MAARAVAARISYAPEVGAVLALIIVGVVAPGVVSAHAPSFVISRNDDWAYRRVLEGFVQTGHLSLVGWGSMTLVGQILWAAPFVLVLGSAPWAAGVSVAVASSFGLLAAYALARSFLGQRPALACCSLLFVLPGFLLNTTSFMTDVPAFAAAVGCLALGGRALPVGRTARPGWLAGSMAVGVVGFSVREFDLAAPVAVLVVAGYRDRRHLRQYLATAVAIAAASGVVYLWASRLPGAQDKSLVLPTTERLWAVLNAYLTGALFLLPFLPSAFRRALRRLRWRAVPVSLLPGLLGLFELLEGRAVLTGNYVTRSGALGAQVLVGYRPGLVPKPAWDLLEVATLLAGCALTYVILGSASRLGRKQDAESTGAIMGVFAALSCLGLAGYVLFVNAGFFDRYLWLPVFAGAMLLASSRRLAPVGGEGAGRYRHPTKTLSVLLALGLALLSSAITLNADAYDAARWGAGSYAVRAGFKAANVDAGFEWVGANQVERAAPGPRPSSAPPFEAWYDEMFPGFKDCAVVSGSPLVGSALTLLRRTTYQQLLLAVPEHLYVYGVQWPGCPA